MTWFLLGRFSKGCRSSEADLSLTPLCPRWSSRQDVLACSLSAAGAVTTCWLRFTALASFSRTWNLSKPAVYYIRVVIQVLKKPSRHFCTPVLTRQHKTFLQSSSGISYVLVMWVQFGPEKCPAYFLCFFFKALGDSYLSAIKPQFLHEGNLSFYSLFPQRNHLVSSVSRA